MKKVIVVSLILAAALAVAPACKKSGANAVSFEPAKPQPGKPVTITYRPAATPLADAAEVSLVAYTYTKGTPTAVLVPMTRAEKAWAAAFTPDAKCRGAVLKFLSGDIVDSNAKKGYDLPLYDAQGNLVPGSQAGLAEAYASWGNYFAGMDVDQDKALELFDKEFAAHPEMKREYLFPYFGTIARTKKATAKALILGEIASLETKPDLNKDDLNTIVYWSNREQNPELAMKYMPQLLAIDPQGDFAQGQKFEEFYQTQDPAKKVALADEFRKQFPTSQLLPQLDFYVVTTLLNTGGWPKAKAYLETHADSASSVVYANLALQLMRNDKTLPEAEPVAARAVELARQELQNPKGPRPSFQTAPEQKEQLENSLGESLDAQGGILLKVGKKEEAAKALGEAVSETKGKNPTINEHFAVALSETAAPREVMDKLAPLVSAGNSTATIKSLLRAAYTKDKGGDTGLDAYVQSLEDAARAKLRASLGREIMDIPAPDFSLQDLEGKQVSLAGLRGKTVVVDFWATWCGPCQASFPGMKVVVEKFRNNPQVEVLFINSWERTQDKKKSASDFMTANSYPFHVLLDLDNKVIDSFKVDGIPTKFVIDKNGRVRFKSIGFDGSTDKLAEELSLMVDMVK